MAQNSLNSGIVEALNSLGLIGDELELIDKQILSISKKARNMVSIDSEAISPKVVTDRINKNAKAVTYLNETLKQEKKLQNDVVKQLVKKEQSLNENSKAIAKQRFETQQINKVNKENAVLSSKLATEYQKQAAKLSKLRREYKDLATRQEIFNDLTEEQVLEMKNLGREANKIDKALKKVDKAVGQSQRNVGNYKGALVGVQDSYRMLSSLAGAFGLTIGVSIFVDILKEANQLAKTLEGRSRRANIVFGNSLQFVTDQAKENARVIGTTKSEYIGAAASVADLLVPLGFQRDTSAQLATEVVNLSGALSDWVGGQYSAVEVSEILQKAILGETEQLKQLGIVIDQSSKDFNNRIKQMEVEQGLTREQARALDILNQITTKSTDAQTAFADGSSSIAIQQERANAQLRESKELFAQSITPTIIGTTKAYSGILADISLRLNSLTEAQDKTNSGAERFAFTIKALVGETIPIPPLLEEWVEETLRLETSSSAAAKALREEAKAFIALHGSIAPLTKAQQEEADNRLANLLYLDQEAEKKRTIAEIDLEISKLQESLKSVSDREDAAEIQRQIKLLQQQRNAILGIYEDVKVALNGSTAAMQEQINKLEQSRSTTAVTSKEYQDFTNQIEGLEHQIKELNGTYDKWLDSLVNTDPAPFNDLFSKEEDLNLPFFDDDEIDLTEYDNDRELLKRRLELRKEFYDSVKDLAFQSVESIFQSEANKYDKLIDANNDYFDSLLENENLSEDQKKALEEEQEKRNEKLERKKEKAQKKAFIASQAAALADVAIQTAKAIAAAQAPPPVGLGPVLGASLIPGIVTNGAIQAGIIAAQAIPQFKDGHLAGTYDGLALINDAKGSNYKEILERSNGNLEVFNNRNQLIQMDKGDRVHKAGTFEPSKILQNGLALSAIGIQEKIDAVIAKSNNKPINIGNSISRDIRRGFKGVRINGGEQIDVRELAQAIAMEIDIKNR